MADESRKVGRNQLILARRPISANQYALSLYTSQSRRAHDLLLDARLVHYALLSRAETAAAGESDIVRERVRLFSDGFRQTELWSALGHGESAIRQAQTGTARSWILRLAGCAS